jgi:hypothetical protein
LLTFFLVGKAPLNWGISYSVTLKLMCLCGGSGTVFTSEGCVAIALALPGFAGSLLNLQLR